MIRYCRSGAEEQRFRASSASDHRFATAIERQFRNTPLPGEVLRFLPVAWLYCVSSTWAREVPSATHFRHCSFHSSLTSEGIRERGRGRSEHLRLTASSIDGQAKGRQRLRKFDSRD